MNANTPIPVVPLKPEKNFWPIAIVLAFAFFISFILGAVVLMTKNKSELISEDYYVQEIGYQKQIDKELLSMKMGKTVTHQVSESGSAMIFTFPVEKGREKSAAGTIRFMRPSDMGMDFSVDIKLSDSGTQTVQLDKVQNGLWNLSIDWKEASAEFYQSEDIRI